MDYSVGTQGKHFSSDTVIDKIDDLNPEEERKLSEIIKEQHGHEFIIVTEYPIAAQPFYHIRLESDESLTKALTYFGTALKSLLARSAYIVTTSSWPKLTKKV